jgi:hypothetical protein
MKTLLSFSFLLLLSIAAFGIGKVPKAQKVGAKKQTKALPKKTTFQFGLLNSAISTNKVINGTPHLGVEVGFSVPLNKNAKKQRFTVGADAGYFFQKGLQSGAYIKPNIAYTIPVAKGVTLQPRIGLGYMLTTNSNNEFKLGTNGEYSKISPYNSQMLASVGVQPNFSIYNSKQYRYNAYLRYEFGMQTPFSTISTLLPMTMMHIGLKIENQ